MPFDEAFFREEERCGYTVSAEMKKIWAVELELLDRFQQVCRAHQIRYFAAGGTLIGAVRHKGMIPWDDDIDIVMLREDYDKLLQVAPTEFTAPYFFQTAYNDKRYSRGHAQLRDSRTTAILKMEKGDYPFNQGIFIDIFPMDAVPDEEEDRLRQRRAIKKANRLLSLGVRYPSNEHKNAVKAVLHGLLSAFYPYRRAFSRLEKACRVYNGRKTRFVAPLAYDAENPKLYYTADAYREAVTVPFEHTTIAIPIGYDQVLRSQYGDYQQMKKENSYHGTVIFDTNRSYTEYLEEFRKEG